VPMASGVIPLFSDSFNIPLTVNGQPVGSLIGNISYPV